MLDKRNHTAYPSNKAQIESVSLQVKENYYENKSLCGH